MVFDVLDHRQQQVRVAGPDEDPVDAPAVAALRRRVQPPQAVGQQNHRQPGATLLDLHPEGEGIHLLHVRGGDDEAEGFVVQPRQSLAGRGDPGHARRMAEVQPAVLVDDARGQAPVLLHDEGIVGAGDQQDLPHLDGHQLVEDLEVRVEFFRYGEVFGPHDLPGGSLWHAGGPPKAPGWFVDSGIGAAVHKPSGQRSATGGQASMTAKAWSR